MKLTKKWDLGQNIVNYAFSFVGRLPYVWGGASLEYGADCCGFTMALY
jgi:cell wall-associated NlpC family hydrolase